MKPINKHLVEVAIILAIVTIVSLGIRQFRLNSNQARKVESPVVVETELESDMDLLRKINYKAKSQYTDASEPDGEVPGEDDSEAKPSKNYTKAKSKKGLEKISLGDNEDLYVTEEGELWYVSGKVKMQVEIDETTGRMNVINIHDGRSQSSQGSKDLERISMSDNEDLYITGEGELWYVSEQPDGSTTKNPALYDETTGELILIDNDEGDK